MELESNELDKETFATMEAALVNALIHGLAIVNSHLATSRVEGAYSHWCAHSVVNGANKVEEGVIVVLMAVSGEASDAT